MLFGCAHHSFLGQGVHKIKDHQHFYWLYPLIRLLLRQRQKRLTDHVLEDVEALMPVPLERKKLRKRGFNQSYLIAEKLGDILDLPILDQHMVKHKETCDQKELTRAERQKNLKGAFTCVQVPPYQRIALIDDVFTTGATASLDAI